MFNTAGKALDFINSCGTITRTMRQTMREQRASVRLTKLERETIEAFAEQYGLKLSEAIRRLLYWSRTPDFVLPLPNSRRRVGQPE
jgi:hypothetical protein